MKKIAFAFTLIFPALLSVQAQQKFTIDGKLTGLKEPAKIMLSYGSGERFIEDSVLSKDGRFVFRGEIDEPTQATLALKLVNEKKDDAIPAYMQPRDEQDFYIEAGKTTVKGTNTMEDAVVKGGKTQKEYQQLEDQLRPLQEKMAPLSKKMQQYFQEKNETAQNELFPQLRAIRLDMNKVEDAFIARHNDSYVTLDMIKSKAGIIDPKTFEPLFNGLSPRMQNTKGGKQLAEALAIAKKVDVGQPAIAFTQNNTEGVPVSLSSLKGKYVLVDFWASWCGPCRAENPNVLKAYNKFKDKNFEIIGVSLDSSKDPWVKAIEKDGLPWIHVSDLQGWKNAVAVEYGVRAVPQNFLLDPQGMIIAKDLRGEELEKTLGELIKN